MARDVDIRVEGLREFRRDLKRLDSDADKELRKNIKDGVEKMAAAARADAPHGAGPHGPKNPPYASTIKPYVSGVRASIGSIHPGAGVIHFGGTISPRGVPITFKPRPVISEAVDRGADRLVDDIGDGIERAAKRVGWH